MNLNTGNGSRIGRAMTAVLAAFAFALIALAQSVTTTTVQGTVYFANGQPASGSVQISWPAFTTAGGQAIAAGTTSVTIGADGFLSVNLAPNQGSSPAGLFYSVTYYLSNGSTNTEYWVVPAATSATLAQVRASVMPSSQAIQTVSKSYVDQAIANISQGGLSATGGTLTGPLYLAGDPSSSLQAVDKHYVDAAVAQTVPLSGATLTGPLKGPAVNASVNNVINVMAPPYNAKGDCTTDDQAAIQAALNAAQAQSSSNPVVYFPTPPGGCYLTSTLHWLGQSLRGEEGNNQNLNTWQGVTIKGKPGEDILNVGDPNTTSGIPTRLWTISGLRFLVDDSVNAAGPTGNFPHRWPGKWVGDGAMNAGSATLNSTYAEFTCADIGQNVLVKGAGASGADLSTTISSVAGCSNSTPPTTVTLAASAATTVSNALVYIAIGGMPVTQQIGNCAIAFDNSDGNSSDWLTGGMHGPLLYDNLHNVTIGSVSNQLQGQNNSCGIFFQGTYMPYGLDARNVNISRIVYGVVQGLSDVNPLGSASNNIGVGQDYQLWDHGYWGAYYPWISYDSSFGVIRGIELYSRVGPQFLKVKSVSESSGIQWQIEVPEFEQPSGAVSGWRIDTDLNTLVNTSLASNAGNYPAHIEGFGNRCVKCGSPKTLNLGGYNNNIQLAFAPSTINDNGVGNSVSTLNDSFSFTGQSPTLPVAQNATKGTELWGRLSADFIRSGNAANPYMNLEDLIILPGDVHYYSGHSTLVYSDPTSITDQYGYTSGSYSVLSFANPAASALTGGAANYEIGGVGAGKANVPATKAIIYVSAKCPTITSYPFSVYASGTLIASSTFTCSTTYTTGSVTVDFSAHAGQNFTFGFNGSGEVDWAYVAVRPFKADYNGYQPLNKAGDTMTGPLYLSGDPTTSNQAATKNYVDSHTGGAAVLVSWGPDTSGSPGNTFTQNYTTYYTLQLSGSLTVNSLRYRVLTADNTANLYDFGIYSVSGTTATLVTDIGPTAGTTFAPGTGFKMINFPTAKTLSPGVYLIAMTTNCASSCAVLAGSPVSFFSLYTSAATSGSSTGGQLPSTITGLSSSNASGNTSSWTGFDVY